MVRNMLCFCIWEGPHTGSQKPPLLAMLTALSDELKTLNAQGNASVCNDGNFRKKDVV